MHAHGRIVELNPVMRYFIVRSEWLFALVKGLTLLVAWITLAWYFRYNQKFVRNACLIGTLLYVAIWLIWFFAAR